MAALVLLDLTLATVHAADGSEPARPKDAAEAVQEGNVDNWLKYYQRERAQGAPPASPATPAPQPDPPPAQRR